VSLISHGKSASAAPAIGAAVLADPSEA
jgi:hypothetical protein